MSTNQYQIRFLADVVKVSGSGGINVSRKRGVTTFTSKLTEEELLEESHDVVMAIASDLDMQGIKVVDMPQIISIKPLKKKTHGN